VRGEYEISRASVLINLPILAVSAVGGLVLATRCEPDRRRRMPLRNKRRVRFAGDRETGLA